MLGVEGRFFSVIAWPNGKLANQQFKATRYYKENGRSYRITAEVRFDDECRNGHESFAITADIREGEGKYWREYMGGCCHDEIAKRFPEFAPIIKWHLCSTDGPLHYLANTLYQAGDIDHNGLRKDEVRQIRNGKTGVPCWILEPVKGKPEKYVDSETQPAAPQFHYAPWNRVGEGKARELDHARSSAIWPEATDAELSQDRETLRAVLEARLPALMAEFKAAMIACGFIYPAE
jgi:hypothetical protein